MATTGIVNGTIIGLYADISGTLTKVANATSHSLSLASDMIEVTNKDSAGWKEFLAGEKGGTISVDGRFEEDGSVGSGAYSFKDLMDKLVAGTTLLAVWGSNVTGDVKTSVEVYVSNLELSAPQNDAASFTCSLQITGAVTFGTF